MAWTLLLVFDSDSVGSSVHAASSLRHLRPPESGDLSAPNVSSEVGDFYTTLSKEEQEGFMPDHIYKSVEITGSSKTSSDDAVRNAIARAAKTLHNLRWFEVTEIRGHLEGEAVGHWQVTLKIAFTLDE
jgi:flavin-binding protein dodecin